MKMFSPSAARTKATALLILIGSLAGAARLNAQTVFLTFTGGGGTPLAITWTAPITYTIVNTPNPGTKDPYFVFNNVGNIYNGVEYAAPYFTTAGAPTYSGNGDPTFAINSISSGEASHNAINSPNQVKFRHVPAAGVNSLDIGDVFTLSSGTLTTSINYSGTIPTDGFYSTFIMDASYTNLGSGTSAIPEPSTYAAIAGGAMLGLALWHRRRRQAPAMTAAAQAAA